MTETQLKELARSRKLTRDIELRSPVSGYVLERNVYPEQRLERGEELYKIADLSRVWVMADLFERDAPYVRAGSPVQLSVPYQDARFDTRVGAVLPQFDARTRTMKVRLEIANPDLVLRPDMFVDVTLPLDRVPTLTIPADAVVDSGVRKVVFVDLGNGYFEPRRVEAGWRADNRVQIVKGLMAGERIVVSGNFLLDSESRMRAVAAGVHDAETDVVCGMDVDRAKAVRDGRVTRHQGQDYVFCSDGCKRQFDADPARYLAPPARPLAAAAAPRPNVGARAAGPAGRRSQAPGPGAEVSEILAAADRSLNTTVADARGRSIFATDPVCGADVETTAPGVLKATHAGKTYYFFSEDCRAAFVKEPDKYIKDR
jgi:YHS domain-containing protein